MVAVLMAPFFFFVDFVELDPLVTLIASPNHNARYLKFDFRRGRYTIEMSSFVDSFELDVGT